jgi:hypothetical protein
MTDTIQEAWNRSCRIRDEGDRLYAKASAIRQEVDKTGYSNDVHLRADILKLEAKAGEKFIEAKLVLLNAVIAHFGDKVLVRVMERNVVEVNGEKYQRQETPVDQEEVAKPKIITDYCGSRPLDANQFAVLVAEMAVKAARAESDVAYKRGVCDGSAKEREEVAKAMLTSAQKEARQNDRIKDLVAVAARSKKAEQEALTRLYEVESDLRGKTDPVAVAEAQAIAKINRDAYGEMLDRWERLRRWVKDEEGKRYHGSGYLAMQDVLAKMNELKPPSKRQPR